MKLGLLVAWIAACSGGGTPGSSTPAAPSCTAPTAGDDACVLPQVAGDVAKKMPWPACLDDAAKRCGVAQAVVQQIWSGHVAAEIAEGFVPLMPVPDGG